MQMPIVLVVFVVYLFNVLATFHHNKLYFQALKFVKTKGELVSTGKKKGYISKGSIAIIACDNQGVISYGEILEGRTIFAKFKQIPGIEGLTLEQAQNSFKQQEAVIQAIGFIVERLSKNEGLEPSLI